MNEQLNNHDDARHLNHAEQTIQRIKVLYAVLDEYHVHSIEQLKDMRFKRTILNKIAEKYNTTAANIYRWIKEYHESGGIQIHHKGRQPILN